MSDAAHGDSDSGGAEASHVHGQAEHLVKMANDIGNFFRAEPVREDAIAGISNHIAKFWTRRMREKLNAHLQQEGDANLDELPRAALRRLTAARDVAAPGVATQGATPQSTAG
jgi:formate dehydrogenase subunit delta